eukprot:CAMPEP_0119118754 /NCGR_PEP_ID=MMETSP1310-20130426/529_1 /TAXON_ID=464262 /ORGANISM="Genus nov. species nov., Strain RCC2339" /LENGTH=113 /DNA_ID=CAMNT_0007108141 /DNA_START=96 /DNA_END=437 /DNA_ORIENTATION=+
MPGVKERYPLGLVVGKIELQENEFDPAFVLHMLSKLNYPVLRKAASICQFNDLPEQPPANPTVENDGQFLQAVFHAISNIDVIEGTLVCFESKREFPIAGGVPNMLVNDFEQP